MRKTRGPHAITRRRFVASSFAATVGAAGLTAAGSSEVPQGTETPRARQLYPGVYQIASLFGGRNLFQYLFVGDNIVLLDTGLAYTPERTIFPALKELGIQPEQMNLAI